MSDGTPFPTLYWLTCPFLAEAAGQLESGGALARWAERFEAEEELRAGLAEAERVLRERRAEESGGEDACAADGIAGQRSGVAAVAKCLHAHVALALAGVDDPVGVEVIARLGTACGDDRCARLVARVG